MSNSCLFWKGGLMRTTEERSEQFTTHPPASKTKRDSSYKPAQDMLFPSP